MGTGVEQGGAAKPRIIPVRSYNCARGQLSPLPCCDAGFRHFVSGAYAGGGVCFEMLPGQIISIFFRGAEVLAVSVPIFRNHLRRVRPGFVSAPDPPLAGCVKSQAAEKEFCAAAKTPLTSRY